MGLFKPPDFKEVNKHNLAVVDRPYVAFHEKLMYFFIICLLLNSNQSLDIIQKKLKQTLIY